MLRLFSLFVLLVFMLLLLVLLPSLLLLFLLVVLWFKLSLLCWSCNFILCGHTLKYAWLLPPETLRSSQ